MVAVLAEFNMVIFYTTLIGFIVLTNLSVIQYNFSSFKQMEIVDGRS